tara:strand:- start:881 stop:1561 length:681 start_codon:yes stop_codon:yes gene_type:complete
MKHLFTLFVAILLTSTAFAQVGINNEKPDASSALDITSTKGGSIPPRMTTIQRDAIIPADTSLTYSIGDVVNGGVVFWLDSTGQHGLVCAFSDVANTVEWGCYGIDLPNVPNVPYNGGNPSGLGAEIGDGFNNTNNILNDCPTAPAALAARSLGLDWFLPSAKELNQMYVNEPVLEAVSGFTPFSDYYWSSTEYEPITRGNRVAAMVVRSRPNKKPTLDVRAIRAF